MNTELLVEFLLVVLIETLSISVDDIKEITLIALWLHVANQRYKCRSHIKDVLKF